MPDIFLSRNAMSLTAKFLPPGPKGDLFFGHFADYSRSPLEFLTRCAREYGDVVHLKMPCAKIFLLNNPRDIEQILTATNAGFINHGGMRMPLSRRLFGRGILISEGDEWRRQKRLTFPQFNHSRIADYAATMIEETETMLSAWRHGETRNLYRDMIDLNLQVMSKTLFGTDLSPYLAETAAAFDTLKDGFLVKNWRQSFGMMLPLPVKSRFKTAVEKIGNITDEIIRQRRAKNTDTNDLLSVLMAAQDLEGNPISDRQLRDEVKTFLFTGHQATGAALAWTFYLLAKFPETEKRLQSEIAEVLGDESFNVSDLKRLNYASAVLKETLRLYPPGWAVGRESVEDCEVGGYFAPAGSQFVMSQWVVHRDSRFWKAAEDFCPERWTDEAENKLPKYAYFPHSGGARFCMGGAFAEMMSIIVMTLVVQKFHLRLANNRKVEPLPSFGLIPKDGIEITLAAR